MTLLVLMTTLTAARCTLPGGQRWGERASFPSWEILKSSTWKVLKFSAGTGDATTAWARVESRDHYPTEVLAGMALGHFITAVIHDSMMGLDTPVQVGVELDGKNGHLPL